MINKVIFGKILSQLSVGSIKVKYWDDTVKTYGVGDLYSTITIKDPKVLKDIILKRDLGFGEAYMDERIIVSDEELLGLLRLTEENSSLITNSFGKKIGYKYQINSKKNQKQQIESHYDLGNEFYQLWLDDTLTYTCAYFKSDNDTLEQAQRQKIDHVLRKLQLQKGQEFVDIGCGWGYLVITAAKKYGARGLGVTLSKEQYQFANNLAKKEGVDHLVSFENINYQDLISSKKQYDRVVSVGILEHIGKGNLNQYFNVVNKLLKPGGISVLHSITQQHEREIPAWIDKYIFPGGYIPSLREIIKILPDYGMRIIDIENLRPHYVLTLKEWLKRFNMHIPEITNMYDDRFIHMWKLYLIGSISSFNYGDNDLSQIVFTKGINNDIPITRDFLYKG
jgi:cyclopropane-fatty-acyl-phospholipid synthase